MKRFWIGLVVVLTFAALSRWAAAAAPPGYPDAFTVSSGGHSLKFLYTDPDGYLPVDGSGTGDAFGGAFELGDGSGTGSVINGGDFNVFSFAVDFPGDGTAVWDPGGFSAGPGYGALEGGEVVLPESGVAGFFLCGATLLFRRSPRSSSRS